MSVRLNRLLTFSKGMLLHGDVVRAAADAGAEGTETQLRVKGEAWLKHPDVQDVLSAVTRKDVLIEQAKSAAMRDAEDELDTRDGKRAWLKRVIKGELGTEKATERGDVVQHVDMKDQLAAFKMLATMDGEFIDRKEINVTNTARVIAIMYDNGRGPLPPGAEVVAELPADLNGDGEHDA